MGEPINDTDFWYARRRSPLSELYLETLASVYEPRIPPGVQAHREGRVALIRGEILRRDNQENPDA